MFSGTSAYGHFRHEISPQISTDFEIPGGGGGGELKILL